MKSPVGFLASKGASPGFQVSCWRWDTILWPYPQEHERIVFQIIWENNERVQCIYHREILNKWLKPGSQSRSYSDWWFHPILKYARHRIIMPKHGLKQVSTNEIIKLPLTVAIYPYMIPLIVAQLLVEFHNQSRRLLMIPCCTGLGILLGTLLHQVIQVIQVVPA